MDRVRPMPAVMFEDLKIRHNLMACFTNRHLFSSATLTELSRLRSLADNYAREGELYLEQSVRRGLVQAYTQQRFNYVHDGRENIYTAYHRLWNIAMKEEQPKDDTPTGKQYNKVLIFPGSRKVSKQLPHDWVAHLQAKYTAGGTEVRVAGLEKEIQGYNGIVSIYRNFEELITLVHEAEMIISADSLPAHLAQFFHRPHEVHYRKVVNTPWSTPNGKVMVVGMK